MMQIEKRIERLAERTDVALQPIELRKRILDDVEALIEPAGRGRHVLPFNWIGVTVAAADTRRRAAIEAVLDDARRVCSTRSRRDWPRPAARCRRACRRGVVRGPARRRATGATGPTRWSASVVPGPTADPDGRRSRGVRSVSRGWRSHAAAATSARLVVVKGEAAEPVVPFAGDRLNVGRLAEVLDKDHRVIRRNQLVFSDVESPVNQTVSRAQAHIRLTESGEYRLYDDHSTYGTRVFRGGRTLEIPSGSPARRAAAAGRRDLLRPGVRALRARPGTSGVVARTATRLRRQARSSPLTSATPARRQRRQRARPPAPAAVYSRGSGRSAGLPPARHAAGSMHPEGPTATP